MFPDIISYTSKIVIYDISYKQRKNNSNLLLCNKIQYLIIELRISIKVAGISLPVRYYLK